MRVSRKNYDKYHRCPSWSGAGWGGRGDDLCSSGSVALDYEDRFWRFKTHRCKVCNILTLPQVLRWLEWKTYWYEFRFSGTNYHLFKLKQKFIWRKRR